MTSRSSLERFVPRVASEWDTEAQGSLYREIDGTLCFVDISGFTNLSEKLARRGRIGAEELTDVLDRVFGEMLRLAYDRGGSLLKFGGDALLLLFEGPDHPLQGVSAAIEMRAALREATKISTSVGRIALRMSVGLHTGAVDFYRVGDSHHELVVTGAVATTTTEMEGAADANDILISPALARTLPSSATGDTKGPGVVLRWRKANADPVGPQHRVDVGRDVIANCVPIVLRANLIGGIAEPEHRVATVAFVKFKGIADAMAAGGPDQVAAGLDELVRVVQDAADTEGVTFLATDIDADGGKIILTAGAPVTQEDDEGRALRAARQIADAGTALPLRIGVNRGHVFAGEIGTDFRSTYTVMGDTVNLAARLMAAAPAGGVYVAPTVLDRSRTLFEVTPLEPFRVKGKDEPVQAYALGQERGTRIGEVSSSLPFRGRDAELARLGALIDSVGDESSRSVVVVGETGMGKSRLVEEAVRKVGAPVFRIQGEATGADNPYWATRDPLRNLLGISRRSQTEMAADLHAEVADRAPDLAPMLPLLGDVAHIDTDDTPETAAIDPRFRPDRTATALAQLLGAVFGDSLVLVAEDRHWLDDATLGLLERLPGELEHLLVIQTTRPPAPELEAVTLDVLSEDAARDIALAATEATPLRPHELDAVVARAGGNPLFLEEILRLIRETGNAETLPESLDAVVGAEIDTLPPLARRLLRYSSVLGRTFRRVVLDELLAPENVVLDDSTRDALSRFLDPEGTERLRFRHAVMLDAAYEGLSYNRRRELHARAGQVIEKLAGEDTHAVAEFLALHYARAGEHGPAWKYGVVAGDKARDAFVNVEAAGHYRRALESTRRTGVATPQERAKVWGALGDVQEQSGEYEAAVASFATALRLLGDADPADRADLLMRRSRAKMRGGRYASALADLTRGRKPLPDPSAALARLESLRAVIRVTQERYREAIRAGHRAEKVALAAGEDEALARAYGALDWAYYMSGQPSKAVYGEKALEIYQRLGLPDKAADLMLNIGAWAYYEGRWNEAVDWYEQARAESRRAGNEIAAAGAAMNIAEVRIGQGRLDEAAPDVDEAVRAFRSARDAYGGMFAEIQLGRLLLGRGEAEPAAALFERLRDEAMELGQALSALEVTAYRASALVGLGQAMDALEELDAAEKAAGHEADMLRAAVARARAEALLALGRHTDALEHATAGLDSARAFDLAYDEVLLIDLQETAGSTLEREDAERRASLRIQLGLGPVTTTA